MFVVFSLLLMLLISFVNKEILNKIVIPLFFILFCLLTLVPLIGVEVVQKDG